MIKETEIVCPPGQHEHEAVITRLAAASLNIQPKNISAVKILKRSIDARGRKVVYRMQVQVFLDQAFQPE
ncbi:MAG TPA: hypothetical protein VK609_23490, partial [Mucilaginibacter sp.]|nr:hypothetical protein [Mucilaginibacter sp.]